MKSEERDGLIEESNYSQRHRRDGGATELKRRRYGVINSFHFVRYVEVL